MSIMNRKATCYHGVIFISSVICSYFYSSFFGTKEIGKSSTVSSIDGCKDNYPEITILKITLCDDC